MDDNPLEFDLGFLDDSSKLIKEHLQRFVNKYEYLSDEQRTATKKWLEALVALGQNPPALFSDFRIVLDKWLTEGDPEQGEPIDAFHWRLPADILFRASTSLDQTNTSLDQTKKYVIEFDDILHWFD